jgi:hypothetical protein
MQVYARDGYFCPLTGASFGSEPGIRPVSPQCAHILPFTLRNKVRSVSLLTSGQNWTFCCSLL